MSTSDIAENDVAGRKLAAARASIAASALLAVAKLAIGLWSGMLGAAASKLIPDNQFALNKIGPRLLALGGVATIYVLLTQNLDSELNQSLQYACVVLISITLTLFIKAQKPRAI